MAGSPEKHLEYCFTHPPSCLLSCLGCFEVSKTVLSPIRAEFPLQTGRQPLSREARLVFVV